MDLSHLSKSPLRATNSFPVQQEVTAWCAERGAGWITVRKKENYKLKTGMWKLKSSPLTLKMFDFFFFWMTFSLSPKHRGLNVASECAELCSDSYLVNLLSETMFNIFSDTEGLESFPITLQRWCSALMSPTVDYHLIAAQRALYASPLTILHLCCSQHCNYNNSNNHRSGPRIHFPQPFFHS